MEESEDGFIVRLPAAMLFDKDSAEISGEDAKLFLKRIGMIIAKMPNEVKTDIMDTLIIQIQAKTLYTKTTGSSLPQGR